MAKTKMTSVPVTGLFQSKNKRNLRVGTCSGKYFDAFLAKVKAAVKEGNGMTFFLWKNKDEEGEVSFSLSADVGRELKKRGKPIQEDDDWGADEAEAEPEEEAADPFEDD